MSTPEWISKHYDSELSKAAMEEVFTEFHRLLSKDTSSREPRTEIDEILQSIEWTRLPYMLRVGILRTCWAARNYLPHWSESLEAVRDSMSHFTKDDLDHYLQGLGK